MTTKKKPVKRKAVKTKKPTTHIMADEMGFPSAISANYGEQPIPVVRYCVDCGIKEGEFHKPNCKLMPPEKPVLPIPPWKSQYILSNRVLKEKNTVTGEVKNIEKPYHHLDELGGATELKQNERIIYGTDENMRERLALMQIYQILTLILCAIIAYGVLHG